MFLRVFLFALLALAYARTLTLSHSHTHVELTRPPSHWARGVRWGDFASPAQVTRLRLCATNGINQAPKYILCKE